MELARTRLAELEELNAEMDAELVPLIAQSISTKFENIKFEPTKMFMKGIAYLLCFAKFKFFFIRFFNLFQI